MKSRFFYLWYVSLLTSACVSEKDLDFDGDGFGPEYDCDNRNAAVNPGATEVCDNGIDEDCNGIIDDIGEGAVTLYTDRDGDGYGDPASAAQRCPGVPETALQADDCDDEDKSVHPGASDAICDGVDNDCDSQVDEDAPKSTWYLDDDKDGYGVAWTFLERCAQPDGYAAVDGDCAPDDPEINPGVVDRTCDGVDQDCSGLADQLVLGTGEACPAESCEQIVAYRPDAPDDTYVIGKDWSLPLRCGVHERWGTGWTVVTLQDAFDYELADPKVIEGDTRNAKAQWTAMAEVLLEPGINTDRGCHAGTTPAHAIVEVELPLTFTQLAGTWTASPYTGSGLGHYGRDNRSVLWEDKNTGCHGAVLFGTPRKVIKQGKEWGDDWGPAPHIYNMEPTKVHSLGEDIVRWEVMGGLDYDKTNGLVLHNVELWLK